MKKVLFIDDQIDEWIGILNNYLSPLDVIVIGEADPDKALSAIRKHLPDAVMLDLMFGSENLGKATLEKIKKKYPIKPPVMIITTIMDKSEFKAKDYVLADDSHFKDMLNNKDDFADLAQKLSRMINNAEKKKRGEKEISPDEEYGFIVGSSPKMKEACEILRRVADSDVTVLITGESGTGKEMVARAIAQKSKRAKNAFVAINCAAIPNDLLESELFGYEPGGFSGAKKSKPGHFELANGGTLFLDEIGEFPLHLQAKILRALQEREITRLGGTRTIQIDIRIISATNKNLLEEIEKKTYREDLYYRLNTITMHLPPLRERIDDIELLFKYFIDNKTKALNIRKSSECRDDVLQILRSYQWPGNIREFGQAIERAIILSSFPVLQPDDFMNLGNENLNNTDIFGIAEKTVQQIWDGKLTWEDLKNTFSKKSEIRTAIFKGLIEKWITKNEGKRPESKELAELLKTNDGNLRQKLRECGLRLTDRDKTIKQ